MRKAVLPVIGVFAAGVTLSVLSFWFLNDIEKQQDQANLAIVADQQTDILQDQLSSAVETIESIAALYAASENVSRSEFSRFVRMELKDQPHIQALEWAPRVQASERVKVENLARQDGITGFSFTHRDPQGRMVRTDERDQYFPVYFIEPLKGNEAALGFDLASDPTRLAALNAARDSGELRPTSRIILVQDTEDSYGLLVFQPVYEGGSTPQSVADRRDKFSS